MPLNSKCSEAELLKLQQSSGLKNETIRRRKKALSDFNKFAAKDELFPDLDAALDVEL